MMCTRCKGTGILNIHCVPDSVIEEEAVEILKWIESRDFETDAECCDCCGDGSEWYGIPGEHYNEGDPPGPDGPYAYNGGFCECH